MWSRMGAGNHTPDCYQMGAPFATPVKKLILCRKSPSPQQAIVPFLHVHGLPISNHHIQEHPSMSGMHICSHRYSIKIPSLVYTGAYLYRWLRITFPLLFKPQKPPKTNTEIQHNICEHIGQYIIKQWTRPAKWQWKTSAWKSFMIKTVLTSNHREQAEIDLFNTIHGASTTIRLKIPRPRYERYSWQEASCFIDSVTSLCRCMGKWAFVYLPVWL